MTASSNGSSSYQDTQPTGSRQAEEWYAQLDADVTVVETVIAATAFGPFITAFCTELSKRFGASVADWLSRVHLHKHLRSNRGAVLSFRIDEEQKASTLVELDEGLSDEARLALLDLDFTDPAIRGRYLTWDTETEAWMPIDEEDFGGEASL